MIRIVCILLFSFLAHDIGAQSDNPFDIARNLDTIKNETSTVQEEIIEESTKIEGDNPFSISHIPIRKNQYKQIERLNRNSSIEKENISIAYLPLWILAISLCLLAYILFLRKSHLMTLLRSLSNDNFMKMQQYEQNGGRSITFFMGYMLFLINISLFVYLIFSQLFNNSSFGFWEYFLMIVLFFLGKHLVILIISWIFEFQKEAQLYDFTITTIRNILAILFLSLNILLVFGPSIWTKGIAILGVFIFLIFLLSRYYKGMRIARKYVNTAFFHFFLYFCAFELTPWVIMYKVVGGFV